MCLCLDYTSASDLSENIFPCVIDVEILKENSKIGTIYSSWNNTATVLASWLMN